MVRMMEETFDRFAPSTDVARWRVDVRGVVQGIGFRPFVYRLAKEMGLAGTVSNSPHGVVVDIEGGPSALKRFLARLHSEKPPLSRIDRMDVIELEPIHLRGFAIAPSETAGERTALVMPDIAVCADCLREMRDPADRRHRYPFINCAHCGPRFSILESLPYDRPNTTMKRFRMCAQCRAEYEDPSNRRFHAEPIACPNCGPRLALWDANGQILAQNDDALLAAAAEIRAGRIIALKGLGGFQLIADARNADTVATLRDRKHREEKPFALMYPSLAEVHADCTISPLEAGLLTSPEAPIVLLRKPGDAGRIALNCAPGIRSLGIMLPYTPLHHLLMDELRFPVVATSGNVSEEPICIDEHDALERLGRIADRFLVHDRPIVRQVDDSIVRVIAGREMVIRRARGYAPLPIGCGGGPQVFAAGAHMKNAFAMTRGKHIFLGQHIGDLDTAASRDVYAREYAALRRLLDGKPECVAHDMHPDYASTRFARATGLPALDVQHHYAHVLACMAENNEDGPVLGVSWDGTGLGTENTIWGGEFLRADSAGFVRIAHLREIRLPGGESAVREPRRVALGMLAQLYDDPLDSIPPLPTMRAFTHRERDIVLQMLRSNLNSPITTSAGRLFDAVASIAGLCQRTTFEGQAAMALEEAASDCPDGECAYTFDLVDHGGCMVLDWEPVVRAIVSEILSGVSIFHVATHFHRALADAICAVARRAQLRDVALTGGCFQNAVLAGRTIAQLRSEGFCVHWHRFVPPNDGGIAVGQAVYALRQANRTKRGLETEAVGPKPEGAAQREEQKTTCV